MKSFGWFGITLNKFLRKKHIRLNCRLNFQNSLTISYHQFRFLIVFYLLRKFNTSSKKMKMIKNMENNKMMKTNQKNDMWT